MLRLKVSDNRRFLVREDGTPFFYLADTAWNLFYALTREEVDRYMENRAAKQFTVIMVWTLGEFDGLNVPNAYGATPLRKDSNGFFDPRQPDVREDSYDYWDHVDYVIDSAHERGLYVALLPTWGDKVTRQWGVGPEIFDPGYQNQGLAEATGKAYDYGHFLGDRYKNRSNIIWVIGGDRPAGGYEEIWRALARGVAVGVAGTEDYDQVLMTYHPMGGHHSSTWFHADEWLDFNMVQSGHHARDVANYDMIAQDYARTPPKPALDGEARYEDHPVNWKVENGRFDDYDVRQAAYWAVFAGAFGHTYGHYSIFHFYAPASNNPANRFSRDAQSYWYDAIDAAGAFDMTHLRRLMESRPFLARVPNQSMIVAGQGTGADHVQATSGEDGSYAFVYIPTGQAVTIAMQTISGNMVRAWWYDPREGTAEAIGEFANTREREFTPPSSGSGHDWVLVLDGAARNFPAPGTGTSP